jgi:hypothetical protein
MAPAHTSRSVRVRERARLRVSDTPTTPPGSEAEVVGRNPGATLFPGARVGRSGSVLDGPVALRA